MKPFSLILLPLISLILTSCAGYHLGGNKPSHLAHVKGIQVPLFVNDTQLTRADAYATNSAVDAIVRDGTYKITSPDKADAILQGIVESADYKQVSSSRYDTLRSLELSMEITIAWTLVDASNPGHVLEQGKSKGLTRLFAGDNLQVARTNALPDALRRASEDMVSKLADGF
jgi:hypothetical protein